MLLHILFIYFLSFLSISRGEIDQSGWIDPHDMTPDYDKKFFPYDDLTIKASKVPQILENCDQKESQSHAYLKRTINLILNAVRKDVFNDNKYKGNIIFEIDVDKYAKLHEFTSNKFDDLSEIDSILSEILKKPTGIYIKFNEYVIEGSFKAYQKITSRTGICVIIVLSYLFVVYKLMKGNFNYWAIFKFLIINIFIFDFVFMWIRLYQKADIDRIVGISKYENAPNYCNRKTMSTMQVIWSSLSSVDECRDFHQVTLSDIFWYVSPGDVLTEMITRTITLPLKSIGPAIGQFVYGIYGSLPFGVNIILLPVILIFVMIMTCILLSFILNIPIKFNFFHLLSFSFGDNRHQNNGNILTGRTVEKLLDIVKDSNAPRFDSKPSLPTNSVSETLTIENKSDITSQKREPDIIKYNVEKNEPKNDFKKDDYEEFVDIEDSEETVITSKGLGKDGYEPDVVNIDEECRKRKREDGSGDILLKS